MKNNNKKKTFAQRAKEIQKKYTRATTDPIEARDMEAELEQLMQEQEAVRESMGLNKEQQQFAIGGKMNYATGGPVFNKELLDYDREQPYKLYDKTMTDRYGSNVPITTKSYMFDGFQPVGAATASAIQAQSTIPHPQIAIPSTYRNSPLRWENTRPEGIVANNITGVGLGTPSPNNTSTLDPMNTLNDTQVADLNKQAKAATPFGTKVGDTFRNLGQSEYLPSIISGASNIGSNLLLAALSKDNKANLTPAMGVPERINLEPQAEQLRRDATVAKNVALRNARNLGVNSGQALANMGAIGADIDRNLGANLTNLYMGQEGANVGAANQFNLANMQAANQAGMFNEQSRLQNKSNRLDYLARALGTVPGVMKDIQLQKGDAATRQMYENYIKSLGRNYFYSGDLFGSVPINYGVRQ